MPPKSAASRGPAEQKETRLTAVVIADSFDRKFPPITAERPRALMPLVNVPMIEYVLEFLAANGVQDVYVFCCAHAAMITKYLESSKWAPSRSSMRVMPIVALSCHSYGDALREIDRIGKIDSDFILVSGDVVANVKLHDVLEEHAARRRKDKSCIMTSVFKKVSSNHPVSSLEDDAVIALDSETNQLVFFDGSQQAKVNLSQQVLSEHARVTVHYHVLDCHIDVCSPEVLVQFTDNFDYQDLRVDLTNGVLNASEVIDQKLYAHIIVDEYAARVKDFRCYDSISKHLIQRWVSPIVIDSNLLLPTTYRYYRPGVYRERNVALDRSCSIGQYSVIGDQTRIGAQTHISHSVLGRNCYIHDNCSIENSYIGEDVVIEDGVTIDSSFVCDRVVVRAGATISRGSVLSYGVVIAPGHVVPPYTRLTTVECSPIDASDSEISDLDTAEPMARDADTALTNPDHVGLGGVGYKYNLTDDMQNSIASVVVDDEPEPESVTEFTESEADDHGDDDNEAEFMREARETVLRACDDAGSFKNLSLELKNLKLTHDVDFADCISAAVPAILDRAPRSKEPSVLVKNVKTFVARFKSVLLPWLETDGDQKHFIYTLMEYCDEHPDFFRIFSFLLHAMYDIDDEDSLISEQALFEWESVVKVGDESEIKYFKAAQPFLNWLRSAEEESDGDDDGDSSDDE